MRTIDRVPPICGDIFAELSLCSRLLTFASFLFDLSAFLEEKADLKWNAKKFVV